MSWKKVDFDPFAEPSQNADTGPLPGQWSKVDYDPFSDNPPPKRPPLPTPRPLELTQNPFVPPVGLSGEGATPVQEPLQPLDELNAPYAESPEDRARRIGREREELTPRTHGKRFVQGIPELGIPGFGPNVGNLTGSENAADKAAREAAAEEAYRKQIPETAEARAERAAMMAELERRVAAGDRRAEAELNRMKLSYGLGAGKLAREEGELDAAREGLVGARSSPGATQGFVSRSAERIPKVVGDLGIGGYTAAERIIVGGLTGFDAQAQENVSKRAAARSKWLNEQLNPDAATAQDFGDQLVSGVASTAGFIAAGAVGRAVGLGATATTAIAGALPQAEQMWQEAVRRGEMTPEGATEAKKWTAFAMGLGIGGTEAIPIGNMFARLERASGGGVTRYFGAIGASMGEEGLQEGLQKLLENTANRINYGDRTPIDREVADSMLVGALSGAMTTAAMAAGRGAMSDRGVQQQIPAPPEAPPLDPALQQPGTPMPATGTMPPQAPPMTAAPVPQAPPKPTESGAPLPELIIEADNQARLLLGAGYAPEEIADMSREERAAEIEQARLAGVEPAPPLTDEQRAIIFPETEQAPAQPETRRRPRAKGPEAYMIRDYLGADSETDEAEVQIIRNEDGSIGAMDHRGAISKVPPAFQNLPAEEAIAAMFGSHPQGGTPDPTKVTRKDAQAPAQLTAEKPQKPTAETQGGFEVSAQGTAGARFGMQGPAPTRPQAEKPAPEVPMHDRPLAGEGLTSYRYKSPMGWVMIGAKDDADALREAGRSVSDPRHQIGPQNLEVWNGEGYEPVKGVSAETSRENAVDQKNFAAPQRNLTDEARTLLDEIRAVGTPEAENFAKGMESNVRAALSNENPRPFKPEAIDFYRQKLEDFRARAGAAGQPVKEAPGRHSLKKFLTGDSARGNKDKAQLVDELVQAKVPDSDIFRAVDDSMKELGAAINAAGFRLEDVNASTAKDKPGVRAMRQKMSELAGTSARLATQMNGLHKGHKNAKRSEVQKTLREIGQLLGQANALLRGETPTAAPAKPKRQPPKQRVRLAQYLSHKGIRDSGGELKARDLHKIKINGRPLVRPDGISIEDAMREAQELGYFFDNENAKFGMGEDVRYGDESLSQDEFLDALADDAHGRKKKFSADDQAELDAKEPKEDPDEKAYWEERQREKPKNDVRAAADDMGLRLTDDMVSAAADMVAQGEDVETAIERAVIAAEADLAPEVEETFNEIIPGWDDEVQSGPASSDSADAFEEGPADAGRDEEVRPAGERGAAPGSGRRGAEQAEAPVKPPEEIFPPPKEVVDATKAAKAEGVIPQEEANQRIEAWKKAALDAGRTQDNSRKVVLSMFDRTGVWSQPWVDAGYHVIRYDIAAGDDLMQSFPMADIQELQDAGFQFYGILAAPPCTSFAVSGAHSWPEQHDKANPEWVEKKYGPLASRYFDTPLDYAKTLAETVRIAVEFANPSQFHVLENPIGRIQSELELPGPTLKWNPNDYGNPYTKRTYLWGDFNPNLPLAPVEATKGSFIAKLYGGNAEQKAARSMTPDGFAYAFFMANHKPGRAISSRQDLWNPDHWEMMAEREAGRLNSIEEQRVINAIDAGNFKEAQKLLDKARLSDEDRASLQMVIDESTNPEPTTEKGADGKPQTVIPGAEKIGQGEQAQRKADQGLKPKVPQKDTDGLALFNDSSKQGDLMDMLSQPAATPAGPAPIWRGEMPADLWAAVQDMGAVADARSDSPDLRKRLAAYFTKQSEKFRAAGQPEMARAYAEMARQMSAGEVFDSAKANDVAYGPAEAPKPAPTKYQLNDQLTGMLEKAGKLLGEGKPAEAQAALDEADQFLKEQTANPPDGLTPSAYRKKSFGVYLHDAALLRKAIEKKLESEPAESGLSADVRAELEEIAAGFDAAGKTVQGQAIRGMAQYPGKDLRDNPQAELARLRRGLTAVQRGGQVTKIDPSNVPDPVNARDVTGVKPEETLVLMACGSEKAAGKAPLMQLYTGPMWQTLRTHRGNVPWSNIGVLSAKHGFLSGTEQFPQIEPYNERMSEQKAAHLIRGGVLARNDKFGSIKNGATGTQPAGEVGSGGPYKAVIIAGAGDYRKVFNAFVTQFKELGIVAPDAKIVGVSGGIGSQRGQLGEWLRQANGTAAAPDQEAPVKTEGTRLEWEGVDGWLDVLYKIANRGLSARTFQTAKQHIDQLPIEMIRRSQNALALAELAQVLKDPPGAVSDIRHDKKRVEDLRLAALNQIEKLNTALGTVPREQVRWLREAGLTDFEIQNMTPAEREARMRSIDAAADGIEVYQSCPACNEYFVSIGEEGKHYTLRQARDPAHLGSNHIVNLATTKEEALRDAKRYVALKGGMYVVDESPDSLTAKEKPVASDVPASVKTAALEDLSAAPPVDENLIPRPIEELADSEVISQAGLHVASLTARKTGRPYWAVTGALAQHKRLLDALGAGEPWNMRGKTTRSFKKDPTAELARYLRDGGMPETAADTAPAAPPAPAAPATAEQKALLGRYKLIVTKSGDGWLVTGSGTFDAKQQIKQAGGRWDGTSKGWRFTEDPTSRIAEALAPSDAGSGVEGGDGADAGAGADLPADRELRELRQREEARADERESDAAKHVSDETKGLIQRGLKYGIPEVVVREQIEDIGMAVSAFERQKPMFLLANEAGTGKTFVLGGIIRELRARGQKRFVYVTQSEDLIAQIQRDLEPFGLEGVTFVTYAKMDADPDGAVLLFDEAHNIKNVAGGAGRAVKGASMVGDGRFSIFASATPFQNPVEAQFLEPTGVFEPMGGFLQFAKAFGASIKKLKFTNQRTGRTETREIPYWSGHASKKKDGAAARQWFLKQGVMTQRAMRIDPGMVDVAFSRQDVDPKWVTLYDRVNEVYDSAQADYQDENGNSRDAKITAEIARHRENVIKRVLEGSKVEHAIRRARELLADGKNVVIFVETKADRVLGMWRRSQNFKDDTLYTYPQMQRMMAEWEELAARARAARAKAPQKPFADFIYALARHFHEAGLLEELPSTADDIRDALGKDIVGIYTGAVSGKAATQAKKDFLAGKKKVLIATMAKGGTGLSLHDTKGDRPTVQLNINLPWAAWQVDQVAARVARYGLKSPARIEWMFAGNIPWERVKLAPRVGRRMQDMGAIVKGIEVKAAETLAGKEDFDFEGSIDVRGSSEIDVEAKDDPTQDVYTLAERLESSRTKADDTSGGFFATPYPVSAFMTRIADIRPGESVLEPSAGHGNLLRFLPDNQPITAIEQRTDNFAELKGQLFNKTAKLLNGDFLEQVPVGHDIILMNPPFERKDGVGQDVTHVMHAYNNWLNPGGRLIAIMGAGPFFRQNKTEKAFIEWLDSVGATTIQMPENTFKNSGTGVRSVMVIIDRDSYPGGQHIDMTRGAKADGKFFRELEASIPRRVNTSRGMMESVGLMPKPFYSAIERFLSTTQTKNASGATWLNLIRKAPGVKADEITWTGLDDFLTANGNKTLAREIVLDFFGSMQLEVKLVERGGPNAFKRLTGRRLDREVERRADARAEELVNEMLANDEVPYNVDAYEPYIYNDPKYPQFFNAILYDPVNIETQPEDMDPEDIRYTEYTIWIDSFTTREAAEEGVERTLTHMREREEQDRRREFLSRRVDYDQLHREIERELEAEQDELEANSPGVAKFDRYTDPFRPSPEAAAGYREMLITLPGATPNQHPFINESHWSEPNVVAWVRFDERTVDGKRTLLIQEIQSDWHQRGRDDGYADPKKKAEIERRMDELNTRSSDAKFDLFRKWAPRLLELGQPTSGDIGSYKSFLIGAVNNSLYYFDDGPGGEESAVRTLRTDISALINRHVDEVPQEMLDEFVAIGLMNVERERLRKFFDGVPDAPFKENWHELALKKALHWAAEHGYEAIASTTGATQNKRWSLSKRVDSIEFVRTQDGELFFVARKGHDIVVDERLPNEAALVPMIGKEPAEKLLAAPERIDPDGNSIRELSGQDMEVGGKGMKVFYDQKVPAFLNKFARKFGAEVQPGKTLKDGPRENVTHYEIFDSYTGEVLARIEGADPGPAYERYRQIQISRAEAGERQTVMDIRAVGSEPMEPVWVLPINDAMRRSVLEEGFTLFQVKPEAKRKAGRINRGVSDIVRNIVGTDVELVIVNELDAPTAESARASGWTGEEGKAVSAGRFEWDEGSAEAIISVVLDGSPDWLTQNSAYHESFHALQFLGAFSREELNALERATPRLRKGLTQFGFTKQSVDQMPSYEVLAYAFANYAQRRDGTFVQDPLITRIWDTILDFWEALRSFLKGEGFNSANDIFKRAYREEFRDVRVRPMGWGNLSNITDAPRGALQTLGPRAQQTVSDIRAQLGTPVPTSATYTAPYNVREDRAWTVAYHAVADQFNNLVALQSAVSQQMLGGRPLPEQLDTRLAVQLYYGRLEAREEAFKKDFVDPLTKYMHDNDIDPDDLGLYLLARHAPERNAVMAQRDPARFGQGGGSGITDEEATRIINDFTLAGLKPKMDAAAAMVDRIRDYDRTNRLNAGLIDQETALNWEFDYEFYVSLRGVADKRRNGKGFGRTSRGFQARGKEAKEAMGRWSLPDNPVYNMVLQAEEGIRRAEKNRVGKTFLRFIRAFPNRDVAELNRDPATNQLLAQKTRKVLDSNGQVQIVPDPLFWMADNVLHVKVGGKSYYIAINDDQLASGLTNLDAPKMLPLVQAVGTFTRLFSRFQTSTNADFFVINFMRDVPEAYFTTHAALKGIANKAMANLPKAGVMITQSLAGKTVPEVEQWKMHGGKIAFAGLRSVEDIRDDIAAELRAASEKWWNAADVWAKTKRAPRNALKALETVNDVFESTTRLAVFMAAREAGMTPDKAASLARDATVDFNRKGKYGPYMNAAFAFFNAATQGAVKVPRLLYHSKRARYFYGSFIGLGAMVTLFNLWMSDDDEAQKWRKTYMDIPEYQRERMLIIKTGGKAHEYRPVTPLPFALSLPFKLGEQLTLLAFGQVKPSAAALSMLKAINIAFNPLGEGSIYNLISPTITDPIIDLAVNRNFFGAPIYPEPSRWQQGVPAYQRARESTPAFYKTLSKSLHGWTGFDAPPEAIRYVTEYITGGLGRSVSGTIEGVVAASQGKETPWERLPVVRRFMPASDERITAERYYRARDENMKRVNLARMANRKDTDPDVQKLGKEAQQELGSRTKTTARGTQNVWQGTPNETFTKAEKALKELRDKMAVVRRNGDLTPLQKEAQLKPLRQRMADVQRKATVEAQRRLRGPDKEEPAGVFRRLLN